MASGKHLEVRSLNGAVAVGNGNWLDIRGFRRWTVDVKGITMATVQFNGSNEPTQPADTDHGRQLSTIAADGITSFDLPIKWFKVRVSAYTSGTIEAYTWASE